MGIANLKVRLYVVAAVILTVGLGSAVLIYMKEGNAPGGVLGYEGAGGYIYQITPEDSKMYRHDLELFGGKVNVLAEGISRWFVGLWQGKSLAVTVAIVTISLSFGFLVAARRARPSMDSDGAGEDTGDRTC